MPLAICGPRNGGLNTRLSSATSDRPGSAAPPAAAAASAAPLRLAGRQDRPAGDPPEVGVEVAVALALHEGLHGAQALEGVLAVEDPALIDGPQVPLDVVAGERGPAEDHREARQVPGVEVLEVLPHDQRALDQQAAHADGVGADLGGLVDELRDRHLDPEVGHLVAVVGQDDVDQVLADVVDVALDGADHDPALAAGAAAFQVRFEVGHGPLHRLGRLQHERQLHLPGAEQLADHLHALEEHVVDDRQARPAAGQGLVEVGGEAVAVPVDDAGRQPLLHRPARAVLLLQRAGGHVGEGGHQLGQGVVAGAAAVVDEVEGQLLGPLVDLVQGQDPRRVDDGGVEAGGHALVEEHRVEHVAHHRLQTEADVGHAQHRRHPGQLRLDAADGLDGLHGVAPQVLLPGAEREGRGRRRSGRRARGRSGRWPGRRSAGRCGPSRRWCGPGRPRRW